MLEKKKKKSKKDEKGNVDSKYNERFEMCDNGEKKKKNPGTLKGIYWH